MTRSQLIVRLAARFPQLTLVDAEMATKAILDGISARLAVGGRVEIRGFGSFHISVRPPRLGRNPKTGVKVPVPTKAVPHFKPGKELREGVNIDSKIRYIMPVGGNIFSDLGFGPEEAAALKAESDKEIAGKLARAVRPKYALADLLAKRTPDELMPADMVAWEQMPAVGKELI